MATYRLTAEAEDDLQEIADYTFETFGPAQAEVYSRGLRNCFASLVDNPFWAGIMGSFAPAYAATNMPAIPSITGSPTPAFSSCACCISAWTRRGICRRIWNTSE